MYTHHKCPACGAMAVYQSKGEGRDSFWAFDHCDLCGYRSHRVWEDELHIDLDEGEIKGMDNILEAIKKAQMEAEKQNIRANAVVISPEFHYIREHILYENSLMPPMLCGMKAYIDKGELPEEYAFAIVDSDPPTTNEDRIRAKVIDELRSLSVDELIKTVYGVDLREETSEG